MGIIGLLTINYQWLTIINYQSDYNNYPTWLFNIAMEAMAYL